MIDTSLADGARGTGWVGGGELVAEGMERRAPSGPRGDSRSGLHRQLIKGSCAERAAAQLIPFSPPKGKLQRGAPPLKLLQLAALPASSATRFFFFFHVPTSVLLLLLCLAIMMCPERGGRKKNKKISLVSVVAVVVFFLRAGFSSVMLFLSGSLRTAGRT